MTEAERQGYEAQITDALAGKAGDEAFAAPIDDLKDLFCKNWPTVKSVLTALGTLYPPAKVIVGPVILIGDTAHGIICR